jgi:hypothetical protein
MVTLDERSPYAGLRPYGEEDRRFFFGRDSDSTRLTSTIVASPLTVVFGPAGVGKTSIIRAGVMPRLRADGASAVVYFRGWQTDGFLADMKKEIWGAVADSGLASEASDLRLDELILQAADAIGGPVYLLLDQFEEYFLFVHPFEQRVAFESELARAVNRRDTDAHVLLALREDAFGQLDRLQSRIPNVFGNVFRLKHLSVSSARNAIVGPPQVFAQENDSPAGPAVAVEHELADALIDEVSIGSAQIGFPGTAVGPDAERPVEAVLLQFMLSEIWARELADGAPVLRLSTLRGMGGARQVIVHYVERALADLSARDRRILVDIMPHLITPSGSRVAHSIEDLAAFSRAPTSDVARLVGQLSDARVMSQVVIGNAVRYQVYHDLFAAPLLDLRRRAQSSIERRRSLSVGCISGLFVLVTMAIILAYLLGMLRL